MYYINITKEALRMIAVLSEGALRDAISILERCTQDEADKIFNSALIFQYSSGINFSISSSLSTISFTATD